jgi:hypothetical protein
MVQPLTLFDCPRRLTILEAEIDRLDNLSRARALTMAESVALERAIREHDRIAGRTRIGWSRMEDTVARRLRSLGYSYRRIALKMPCRSEDAVAARLRYLQAKEARA